MPGTEPNRRALVTGASGHTGSFLVNLLADHGWHVTATDLAQDRRSRVITKEEIFDVPRERLSIDRPGVEFIPADLTDKETIQPLFEGEQHGYCTVFHTASLYDYFAPFELLERVNVGGLRNLLEACYGRRGARKNDGAEGPRFIHWSTCGVYGQPKYERWDVPADETAPFNPPNDYSRTKMMQERLLEQWHREHGVPTVIIRPAPIYGPYQAYGMFHVYHLVRTVGSVPVVCLYPRSKRLRMPMVHVEDLVRAAEFLADAPAEKVVGEAFNAIGDCGYQEDFMAYIAQLLGADYSYISVPWFVYVILARITYRRAVGRMKGLARKGKRPRYDAPMAEYITHQYFFSNEKIKRLGFKYEYPDMFVGTKRTVDWYLDHGWLEKEKWEVA
ncbi:MAG: NAD(P)-dependent oxidoreductase [Candidatus Lokiarchaeota archaeon]|nr:NAD(P)-dependent oxidoreductase [Candidatus Lokiarchaeota archaeon]